MTTHEEGRGSSHKEEKLVRDANRPPLQIGKVARGPTQGLAPSLTFTGSGSRGTGADPEVPFGIQREWEISNLFQRCHRPV